MLHALKRLINKAAYKLRGWQIWAVHRRSTGGLTLELRNGTFVKLGVSRGGHVDMKFGVFKFEAEKRKSSIIAP